MRLDQNALSGKSVPSNDLWLIIPTATRHDYLPAIIKNSLLPESQIVFIRTTPGKEFAKVHNLFVRSKKINIQRWWNLGIRFAEKRGAKLVAVLNDDVFIAPGSLQVMASEAVKENVPLVFPYPHTGQLAGYCWILNLKFKIRPDNRFKWWYGDNDLQMQAQHLDRYIYVPADVKHIESGNLTKNNAELQKFAELDHYKFIQKWGNNDQRWEARIWRYHTFRSQVKKILRFNKFKN